MGPDPVGGVLARHTGHPELLPVKRALPGARQTTLLALCRVIDHVGNLFGALDGTAPGNWNGEKPATVFSENGYLGSMWGASSQPHISQPDPL